MYTALELTTGKIQNYPEIPPPPPSLVLPGVCVCVCVVSYICSSAKPSPSYHQIPSIRRHRTPPPPPRVLRGKWRREVSIFCARASHFRVISDRETGRQGWPSARVAGTVGHQYYIGRLSCAVPQLCCVTAVLH